MLSDSVKALVVSAIDAEIANLQAQKEQVLSGKFGTQAQVKGKAKGNMSEAGRKSISESAKARHAAKRAAKEAAASSPQGPVPEDVAKALETLPTAPGLVNEPAQAPPEAPPEPKLTVAQRRAAAKASGS
jgi:hypothetical protein